MAELSWLQCQIPKDEWQKLNERRLKLSLRWADILLPATLEQLEKLEANLPAPEQTKTVKPNKKTK
jgi:hypothetical protein